MDEEDAKILVEKVRLFLNHKSCCGEDTLWKDVFKLLKPMAVEIIKVGLEVE